MNIDMKLLLKTKIKATGIHMSISMIIFFFIFYLIYFKWYPEPFFTAEGGLKGIKLMAVIDLVLGPVLTFIIFNYRKSIREIIFDLSVIAAVQIVVLTWGGLQVYTERPVAMVMWEGVFYTVTEGYYEEQGMTLNDIIKFSDEIPLMIFAEYDNPVFQLEMMTKLNNLKIPAYAQVHLYKSLKDNTEKALSYRLPEEYISENLKVYSGLTDAYLFPAKAKYGNLLVFLDSKANLLDITTKP